MKWEDPLEVSMFGVLSVRDGERLLQGRSLGGAKPRGLLEVLLLARGSPVTKDALTDALWGSADRLPRDPFRTLEHYVSVLRHRLSPDAPGARSLIVTAPNSYRFDPAGDVVIDLDRFDALTSRADATDEPATRRALLEEAVELATGDLLEDSPYAPWTQTDRHVYRERVARCHIRLAGDDLLDGNVHGALRHGEAALRFAPICEQAYRLVMAANYELGCDDMARSAFRRCRDTLVEVVDADPTSETAAAAAAIDAGAPASEVTAMCVPAVGRAAERHHRR
jgi:DNA-binding SARP family transcriptional activator